jgi:hypothetical protein
MNPAFLTYPLLNPLYEWNPTIPQQAPPSHDLRPPRLTAIQYDQLLRNCNSHLSNIPIHDTTIPRADFSQLLQPVELPANVVNALFRLGLQAHPDVVFFHAEITHEFSTGTQHRYQRIANVTAANAAALTTMRHQLFDKPQAAFLFAND